jgi:hypothetical protein
MLALKFLLGAMVLAGFGYLLRTPPKGLVRGSLAFVLAFGMTAAGISAGARKFCIVREDPYAQIAASVLLQLEQDPAPYILFVGASYSRNALNDQALGQHLQARGFPYQVINFALEGSSLQERDLRLRQLLQEARRPPAMVFLELSEKFDTNPTYGFEVAKFSNRVIGQFDVRGTKWAMRGLAEMRPQLGTKALAKDGILLSLHTPINLANIGLLAGGGQFSDFEPMAAYDPQTEPRTLVSAQERNHGLLAPFTETAAPAPNWARAFRAEQAAYLKAHGVARVGYYFPPVVSAKERAYVAARCTEYDHCFAPTDIEMLAKLDDDLWFDAEHLLQDGAAIYTRWLADELDNRQVLNLNQEQPQQKLAQTLELRR